MAFLHQHLTMKILKFSHPTISKMTKNYVGITAQTHNKFAEKGKPKLLLKYLLKHAC